MFCSQRIAAVRSVCPRCSVLSRITTPTSLYFVKVCTWLVMIYWYSNVLSQFYLPRFSLNNYVKNNQLNISYIYYNFIRSGSWISSGTARAEMGAGRIQRLGWHPRTHGAPLWPVDSLEVPVWKGIYSVGVLLRAFILFICVGIQYYLLFFA